MTGGTVVRVRRMAGSSLRSHPPGPWDRTGVESEQHRPARGPARHSAPARARRRRRRAHAGGGHGGTGSRPARRRAAPPRPPAPPRRPGPGRPAGPLRAPPPQDETGPRQRYETSPRRRPWPRFGPRRPRLRAKARRPAPPSGGAGRAPGGVRRGRAVVRRLQARPPAPPGRRELAVVRQRTSGPTLATWPAPAFISTLVGADDPGDALARLRSGGPSSRPTWPWSTRSRAPGQARQHPYRLSERLVDQARGAELASTPSGPRPSAWPPRSSASCRAPWTAAWPPSSSSSGNEEASQRAAFDHSAARTAGTAR